MRRQTRTLLALAVGLAVLLGIIVMQQWLRSQRQQSSQIDAASSIQTILVKPTAGASPAFRLQRVDSGWSLTDPETAPALTERVDVMLRLLDLPTRAAEQQISVYAATDLELEAVGLATPRLNVSLDEHDFIFGGRDLQGQRRYIRYGDRVYLAADVVFPLVSTGYDLLIAPP